MGAILSIPPKERLMLETEAAPLIEKNYQWNFTVNVLDGATFWTSSACEHRWNGAAAGVGTEIDHLIIGGFRGRRRERGAKARGGVEIREFDGEAAGADG